jgi:dTDP-4-amino-4,6-dideoxygalactose transaminase
MINVTKTFLPPFEEYIVELESIWNSRNLTNRGLCVRELENELMNFLEIDNILLMANGTLPIQIALKAIGEPGEIITTPFSYVATSSAIVWESFKPVFVDIDKDHFTIDESKIENAITNKTKAILATHVFGNPCNVLEIERIAKINGLYVIYDAAHAFGVKLNGDSIFKFGDISTCSFHATKLFHTGEGGAIFSTDVQIRKRIFLSHNFGHISPTEFDGVGINGKMSELHAALGKTVLPYINEIIKKRKDLVTLYIENLNWSKLETIQIRDNVEWNYSYFPIVFSSPKKLEIVLDILNSIDIFPRRYFFPSLNKIDYLTGQTMPISESLSERVLCLPLYHDLSVDILKKICLNINAHL